MRKILLPVVPIYYLITWLRNKLYELGIKKSTIYDFPIIAVGNLSTGGTGKSPMVEYLIRTLKSHVSLATLSRGYKRETRGFREVKIRDNVKEVGDEPLQFKTKFPDILVAVDGNRRNGIERLRSSQTIPEVILLDDAFQHRKVQAGLYILLTSYGDLYSDDIVLPTGNLREPRSGADRADIIIVSKCPSLLSSKDQDRIADKLSIKENQELFFTTIIYDTTILNETGARSLSFFKNKAFTLVTGIANSSSLIEYYRSLDLNFTHKNFPDHHNFTESELNTLQKENYIITTEKDYVRMKPYFRDEVLWFQPITIDFLRRKEVFDRMIRDFIKDKTTVSASNN